MHFTSSSFIFARNRDGMQDFDWRTKPFVTTVRRSCQAQVGEILKMRIAFAGANRMGICKCGHGNALLAHMLDLSYAGRM